MLHTFFQIGAWLGFGFFVASAIFGGYLLWQVFTLAMTIAFAHWKWRKVRQVASKPQYAYEISKLLQREMEQEESKEQAKADKYAQPTSSTHTKNDNSTTNKTGNSGSKQPTQRKVP